MPHHRHFAPPRPGRDYEQTDPYAGFKLEVAVTVLNVLHTQIEQIVERDGNSSLTLDDMWDTVTGLYGEVFDESILAVSQLDPSCSPQCRLIYGSEWQDPPEVERTEWFRKQQEANDGTRRQ